MSKVEDIHFQNWYNEIEAFSLRAERLYDDIMREYNDKKEQWETIHAYIETAFKVGFREGKNYQERKQKTK